MKTIQCFGLLAGATVLAAMQANAVTVTVDNFNPLVPQIVQGPVSGTFTSPGEASGVFAPSGGGDIAIGNERDLWVQAITPGDIKMSVAFGKGGFASFAGTGRGAIVWDGIDGNADINLPSLTDSVDFSPGLGLDLSGGTPSLSFVAFADLPNGVAKVVVYTDAANYSTYDFALTPDTTLNATSDFFLYSKSMLSPSSTVGTLNFANINAIALILDGSGKRNLDVRIDDLSITVPDGGLSLLMLGLGMMGLGMVKRAGKRA